MSRGSFVFSDLWISPDGDLFDVVFAMLFEHLQLVKYRHVHHLEYVVWADVFHLFLCLSAETLGAEYQGKASQQRFDHIHSSKSLISLSCCPCLQGTLVEYLG